MRYFLLLSVSMLSLAAFNASAQEAVTPETAPAATPAEAPVTKAVTEVVTEAVAEPAKPDAVPAQEAVTAEAPQAAPETVAQPEPVKQPTIGEMLADDGDFDTFTDLLKLAGMDSLLSEQTAPYTLFVPTDSAFSDISDKLKMLKKPENKDKLIDLLNHHIVNGLVKRSDLNNNTSEVLTSTLKRLRVIGQDGKLTVNGIKVDDTDASSNNVVIYKIDAVIENEADRASPTIAEEPSGAAVAAPAVAPAAPTQNAEGKPDMGLAPADVPFEPAPTIDPVPNNGQSEGSAAPKKPWYKFW